MFRAIAGAAFLLPALTATAQDWSQWGQNPRHTGAVAVTGQIPDQVVAQFTYDDLADEIRGNGDLLVHYMAPLVDGDDVFIMSRGDSAWRSCTTNPSPCGTQRWNQMTWGISRLHVGPGNAAKIWTAFSNWKPAPDNGSGWEPVFHPALHGGFVYAPGDAGTLLKFDKQSGALVDRLQPFADSDPDRYVISPITVGTDGSLYYTVIGLNSAQPWTADAREGWLVRFDPAGIPKKVSFEDLIPRAPVAGCSGTFDGMQLPWPPSPDAIAPVGPCGSQRPGLNAAPAVAADGTIYVISRAHLNGAYGYLVAVNADLTPKWSASLRDRLNDGCDVLLPPSGMVGGCRTGSRRGVDPATNQIPAGRVEDQSTASPVIAPDGSILLGTYSRYNYARGHLFHFGLDGSFRDAYDFGWDITPAIFEHDGTWSAIIKDNAYPVGSYCTVAGFCGQGRARYSLTRLDAQLHREWAFTNDNEQSCERLGDGAISCRPSDEKFEWCVNMVAVDRNGLIFANSEDGNLYAISPKGSFAGRVFLKSALGAAYTPLAIGGDGRVYTQNDGVLFVTGQGSRRGRQPPGGRLN